MRAAGAARRSRARLSGAGPARRGPAASGGHFSLILAGCGGKGTRERPRGSCGRRGWVRGRGRVLGPGRAGGAALAAAPPGRASTRRSSEGRWARREGSRTPPGEPPRARVRGAAGSGRGGALGPGGGAGAQERGARGGPVNKAGRGARGSAPGDKAGGSLRAPAFPPRQPALAALPRQM